MPRLILLLAVSGGRFLWLDISLLRGRRGCISPLFYSDLKTSFVDAAFCTNEYIHF